VSGFKVLPCQRRLQGNPSQFCFCFHACGNLFLNSTSNAGRNVEQGVITAVATHHELLTSNPHYRYLMSTDAEAGARR